MSEPEGLDPDLAALFDKNEEAEMDTNGVSSSGHQEPTPTPARRGPPRRRGRGPDKKPRVMGRPAPTPEAGDVARAAISSESTPLPQSVPPSTEFEGSRDALVVWPKVLEEQTGLGFTPDQIQVRVTRVPIGPIEMKNVRAQTIDLVPLIGTQICGDASQSPSEALFSCICNDYHLTYTGPAIYKLTFQYRFGKSGNIPGVPANVELKLDHPAVIKKQLEAKDRAAHDAAVRAGAVGSYYPRMGGYPSGPGPYFPPPAQGQAPAAQPAPNLANPAEAALLRQLAEQNGFYRGLLEGQQTAAAAPAPAPTAPPQRDPRLPPEGMTAEEWENVLAQRQAKTIGPIVVQSMLAMGLTPQLIQSLQAMAQGQGVQQGQTALPVAQPTPSDPLAGFRSVIDAIKGMASMKKDVAKVLGIELPEEGAGGGGAEEKEEDPTQMKPVLGGVVFPGTDQPMSFGSKLEDETWPEYIVRLGTHNPAMAMAALDKLSKVLDPKVLSGIVEKIAMAGAGKQVGAAPPTGAAPAPQVEAPKKTGWQPT